MNTENKDLPAFPVPPKQFSEELRQNIIQKGAGPDGGFLYPDKGITKREYFAAKAMQGLCAKNQGWDSMKDLAAKAVEIADELLNALK